jgi:hypothetical protein
MTEEKWLGPMMAANLLAFVRDRTTDRKLRLFAAALCRLLEHLISDEYLTRALECTERAADHPDNAKELIGASERLSVRRTQLLLEKFGINDPEQQIRRIRPLQLPKPAQDWLWAWEAYERALLANSKEAASGSLQRAILAIYSPRTQKLSTSITVKILRDIFGNPFRPVTLDPRWLSSNVFDLAQTIYNERVWERMPILADALMDAGCDSEEILSHCRGEGPHVRGCWLVDLLLGKS